jgi:predicted metal-dependent RNase
MLTETIMKATGWMIRLMDLAFIPSQMAQNMRETGKRTSSTVRELRPGLMAPLATKANMRRARNMDRVNLNGVMAAPTRDASMIITFRAKVLMMTPESLLNRPISVEGWSYLRWTLDKQQDGGLRYLLLARW